MLSLVPQATRRAARAQRARSARAARIARARTTCCMLRLLLLQQQPPRSCVWCVLTITSNDKPRVLTYW